MDMSGFEICIPMQGRGSPALSVTENGVTFNAQVTTLLRFPEYVQLLVNRNSKQAALRVCEKNADGALKFYKRKIQHGADVYSIRWNSQSVKDIVMQLIGTTEIGYGFRVKGRLIEPGLVLFDMSNAKRIGSK